MAETAEKTALVLALMGHNVSAQVVDLDHYRIRGGMAVETDYIIRVEPTVESVNGPKFERFTLSKTYSSFRTLANQLKKVADRVMMSGKPVDDSTKKLAQYCETVHHLVEKQRTQYLGKVSTGGEDTGNGLNCSISTDNSGDLVSFRSITIM